MYLPSSPVRGENSPLRAKTVANVSEPLSLSRDYPTPNPSSSLGYEEESEKARKVAFELPPRKVEIVSPMSRVRRLKVPLTGRQISIGRSSRSNQCVLNPHNKLVSRTHCSVHYVPETHTLKLHCIGWNGVNVTVPGRVDVEKKDDAFEVTSSTVAPKSARVLSQEASVTNLYILKGETVFLPMLPGLILDIRGELILVETEDELTEDEAEEELEQTPEPLQQETKKPVEPVQTVHEDKENVPPVAKKEPTAISPAYTPEQSPDPVAATKARARSKNHNSPRKKKDTEHQISKEEADVLLEPLRPQLPHLANILVNHLAYSRLLQTPLQNLMDLKAVQDMGLSKQQLRGLLIYYVDCIGVIYRVGKDAAGKPLDEEYYYDPEKDQDKSRVQLVEELKGSASHLRSCRKTHKQYFWKKPAKR
ncbi:hypothetical protein KL933_000503 [Ogataea haglerorum]|uniref:FHA domain-containing protein n=1 Tax=Ogataea haglerorum TaxID=1937702 RepID=A0AAN6D9R7_9ASCO|nr:hypothetical protein KL951_000260 [Ogataea haglerorum]KAG7722441.1 hypothetical protein KL913_000261 [Ogataea haglerorum]KAG7723455.1 hypothetical protein KL949_000505 [Ogataea haglerorum]KAG7730708.1 hypothetical protein KL933_000503 [Ogataea haglerorum]KAG7742887.1 hypothetical protein KL923_000502 [Ogataea haglerorum]